MRYVYVIKNLVNGKVYVGQTKNLTKRKRKHFGVAKSGDKRPLYAAIRKYGKESFLFEILEECDDILIEQREQFWIKQYDSFNTVKGYNLTSGGEHNVVSDETRQRLHEMNVGECNPFYGRHHTEEARHKIGEASKNRSEQTRERISQSNKKHSKLHADVMRENCKRMWADPKHRARMSQDRPRGEFSPHAKLTRKDVLEIAKRLLDGEKQIIIANDFKVSVSTINSINTRKTKSWKDVLEEFDYALSSRHM